MNVYSFTVKATVLRRKEMFKLKVCVAIGIAGAVSCSVLAGISFSTIQTFLLQLDMATLLLKPFFYSFLFSCVGFAGSVGLVFKNNAGDFNAWIKSGIYWIVVVIQMRTVSNSVD